MIFPENYEVMLRSTDFDVPNQKQILNTKFETLNKFKAPISNPPPAD
jgi:hypothetical protein